MDEQINLHGKEGDIQNDTRKNKERKATKKIHTYKKYDENK